MSSFSDVGVLTRRESYVGHGLFGFFWEFSVFVHFWFRSLGILVLK